jgi:hypothetical protein
MEPSNSEQCQGLGRSTHFNATQGAYVDITLPDVNSTGIYYLLTICRLGAAPTCK